MKSERSGAFLRRLAQDTSGNTLAIMAAAFFPLAGLIGGSVDMTRLYITKTRLQQACDAGALAGRKVMGSGSWTTVGANSSREQAYQLFAANFQEGDFGTGTRTREFTESEGTVNGVASAQVPMTIMRIFGESTRTVNVTCTARMEIPNTDVMFVLDITGSMNSDNKIGGLKSAVKCFYEALMRVDTPEVCGNDPTATTYSGTAQIRMGFVPYSVNVNVGKLLPNQFFDDNWTYQTRQANSTPVYAWTTASESSTSWGNWSSPPSNLANASQYSGWDDISGSGSVTINGTSYQKRPSGHNWSSCAALNTLDSYDNMIAYVASSGTLGSVTESGSTAAPVYPATSQTVNYNQQESFQAVGYRYRWYNSGSGSCRLEDSNTRNYSIERNGTASRTVTWTEYQQFTNYTYNELSLNVSALKAGGSSWNGTVSIPNLSTTTVSGVKLSGSNTTTTITIPTAVDVEWKGCVEDRQTFQNTDGDPSDDWDPIPGSALDMDINLVPSDAVAGSKWGPMLPDVVWGRYSGGYFTTNPVTTTSNLNRYRTTYCSTEARKLAVYTTSGDFVTYINSFSPQGNTYHDVGMLWGARLLSPTGIFASENALTANGGAIERHLIFMSDGNAQTDYDNLYSFGLPSHSRRAYNYFPSSSQLRVMVEQRFAAICTLVKNMNVKVWVISYGGGLDEDNEDRLEACASPGHYYEADDDAALIAQFQQIASEIADLRLTQ
jgi:Flp pilus assembly protein TadG